MMDELIAGKALYFVFLGGGLIILTASIFWVVLFNYKDFEEKIINGISDYAAGLYAKFDLMFIRKTMNFCYLLILLSTLVLGAIGFLIGLYLGIVFAFVLAVFFGFLGFKAPGVVVNVMFQRRLAKFDSQLVDALNMMSNAIKSGLSFMQVVQLLEKELPNPASQEFAMVLKENRIGINLNDALMNMTERVPSEDLFMICNSVVTLSQQGGDLSEAFDTIAFTIRERQRVFQKIRTLAQAGITQATILSAIPLVIMGIMYSMQPDTVLILFTTPLGIGFLVAMFILILLGALWMRKILTIEI